jgi:fructose/tagatose bisphosphate aldolase
MTLIDVVKQAQSAGKAVGQFNIADLALLKGVSEAARSLNVPVIVGASQASGISWEPGRLLPS